MCDALFVGLSSYIEELRGFLVSSCFASAHHHLLPHPISKTNA